MVEVVVGRDSRGSESTIASGLIRRAAVGPLARVGGPRPGPRRGVQLGDFEATTGVELHRVRHQRQASTVEGECSSPVAGLVIRLDVFVLIIAMVSRVT
jgi:hypothetical protein